MKHLTPTQYQSLPVNEKCNWKEQYQTRVTSDFTSSGFTEWQNGTKEFALQFIGSHNVFWQLIYIPINPESILNAEMGEQDKIIEHGLKSGGFLFPETINQVEAYEKHFGPGDNQELSDDLKDPHFLNKHISANRTLEVIAETLYPKGDINSHFLTTPLRMSERKAFIKGAEFGHCQGKKDRNKEVIDIVEAEIRYWGYQPHLNGKQSLIRVLTELKEIKP